MPEVNKRLAEASGKDTIEWNEAYGGTIAKLGGVLEAIEEGIADMGFVRTIFEAPKMPLHNVCLHDAFRLGKFIYLVDLMHELQSKIPALAREKKAMETMEQSGIKVVYLSDAERKRWADKLPNLPIEWAESMEAKGLPGKAMLKGYLDGLRARGVKLVRDWDK